MRRYHHLLRTPGALLPFLTALVGRLPISMAPLGMVLLVQQVRGSYGEAGQATAANAIGFALLASFWGRAVDRYGLARVMLPLSVLNAASLAAFTLLTVGGAALPVLMLSAATCGATAPPWTPVVRGAWRALIAADADRRTAFALDAVVMEVVFVVGPLVLSVLLGLPHPAVPLLVTSALMLIGGVGFAVTGAARHWRPEPSEHPDGRRGANPLRVPGVAVMVGVSLLLAIGFSQLDVSLAAIARLRFDDPALVGVLFLAAAGGSGVGGLIYGTWHSTIPERRRVPVLLAVVVCGFAVVSLLLLPTGRPPLAAIMIALFSAGAGVAPSLIIAGNLIDHAAPSDRLGEAQAWAGTAFGIGAAAGSAIAGWLIDAGGPTRSMAGATTAMALALVVVVLGQRVWRGAGVVDSAA